jgi:hypothetical protein
MMFDVKDAILMAFALLIIAFFAVELFLKFTNDLDECDHCFADFQSTGIRKCIDCGLEESIKKTHYPKHQR